jgi:hypothetical protein
MYSPTSFVGSNIKAILMTKKSILRKTKTKTRNLRGKGDYSEQVSSIPERLPRLEAKIDHLEQQLVKKATVKNAASSIGRLIGNFAGQGDLGSMAGEGLAKLFGHGDYSVKGNSLMTSLNGPTLPKFTSTKRGVRVVEREYLGDLVSGPLSGGSTAFTIQQFPLNPTNSSTFPWGSQMADLFDQWEPNGLVFEFVTTSSEFNGASQALGAVIMATDYDPYDPIYPTKVYMENADYSNSTKPACSLIHGVECDPKERPTRILYTDTQSTAIPLTSTLLGNFYIASQGCSVAGVTLGEIWISYDVTFYKKQLNSVLYSLPFYFLSGVNAGGTGYLSAASLLLPTQSYVVTISTQVGIGNTINFNNTQIGEKYQMTYWSADSALLDSGPLWTPTNCTLVTLYSSQEAYGAGFHYVFKYIVTCTAANSTVQCGLRTVGGNFNFDLSQTSELISA